MRVSASFLVLFFIVSALLYGAVSRASETGRSGGSRAPTSPRSASDLKVENGNPVTACLANRSIPDGKTTYVSGEIGDLCQRAKTWSAKDYKKYTKRGYTITKKNGEIVVGMKLHFYYNGSEKTRPDALKRLESNRVCVEQFYRKFGLHLNLDFDVNTGLAGLEDWWKSDSHTINLWNQLGHSDDQNFVMYYLNGHLMSQSRSCAGMAHEIGHHLGLPDEYITPDCPDRVITAPGDDLMNEGELDLERARLYSQDLQKIIAPICGD